MNLVGKKVAVMHLCMLGNEPTKEDKQYVSKALNQVVEIKHEFENGFYLTDFFMPEHIEEKNDYCYYGFLILERQNFNIIEGY